MPFFDTHTHSEFSPDSKATVEGLLLRARECCAGGIAITDHLDLDAPRNPGLFEFSIEVERIRAFHQVVRRLCGKGERSENSDSDEQ